MCAVLTDISKIYSFLDSAVSGNKACPEVLKNVEAWVVDV